MKDNDDDDDDDDIVDIIDVDIKKNGMEEPWHGGAVIKVKNEVLIA